MKFLNKFPNKCQYADKGGETYVVMIECVKSYSDLILANWGQFRGWKCGLYIVCTEAECIKVEGFLIVV